MAKDLISKILVVDPVQRITISEIRQHPWFTKDLPEYLSIPPVVADREMVVIDEDVLDEVFQKLGESDRNEAAQAITGGIMNPITVAYFLILDNKMKNVLKSQYQQAQMHHSNSIPLMATSPQQKFSIEMVLDQRGQLLDKESTQMGGVNNFTNVDDLRIDTGAQTQKKKYHLGLRITKPTAADAMKEVYHTLKTIHMVSTSQLSDMYVEVESYWTVCVKM